MIPAILATAYHSLVGSSGPVSRDASAHGLRGEFRINAGRSQKLELLHARVIRGVDNVDLDGEIIVEKLRRTHAIGENSTDARGREEYVFGPFRFKKLAHGRAVAKIELVVGPNDQPMVALPAELAADR